VSKGKRNTELVQKLYERLQALDLAAVEAQLDASFVLRATDALPYGGRREGRSAFADSMQGFLECWESPRFDVRGFTCNDESLVVAHIELSALSKAGVAYFTPVIECWTLVDDRVTALDVYYLNPAAALRAIRGGT
jgi:ketosteroid isomerase-like protein